MAIPPKINNRKDGGDTGGKNRHDNNTYQHRKKDIDEVVDEFFRVGSYFLQNTERFPASLVLKFLVG